MEHLIPAMQDCANASHCRDMCAGRVDASALALARAHVAVCSGARDRLFGPIVAPARRAAIAELR
jgi:hypothetical protein